MLKRTLTKCFLVLAVAALLAHSGIALAAELEVTRDDTAADGDWPMYRYDTHRSASTPHQLDHLLHLHCVDAATGQRVWRFCAAPNHRMVLGNGRVISMWPVRGGQVIADGTLYFAAGIWPNEGVFLVAIDAYNVSGEDGGDNERWNNNGWDEDSVRWGAARLADGTVYGLPPLPDAQCPGTYGNGTAVVDKGSRTWTAWHPYFGSAQPGGANFVMADGAVRMFAYNVDGEVFRRVSLSRSGLPVELP